MYGKVYFKGLDGIRAIAAFIVVIFHIDQYLPLFGLPAIGYHTTEMASYGVVLFFVLSGFLITYLLMSENKDFGTIDLRKFYTRRILRIWPIYYLIILISLVLIAFKVISDGDQLYATLGWYSLLMANVGFAFGYGFITIAPLWSIAIEEQFYAFWPLVIKNSRKVLRSLLWVFAGYFLLKILLRVFENGPIYKLISITAFDCMAIGGIGAYLLFTRHKLLIIIYHPAVQVAAWIFFVVGVLYKPLHVASIIDKELHAVFYAIIIINLGSNVNSIVNLEHRLLNFLGRISYGLYVYHMLVIVLLSYFFKDALEQAGSLPVAYALVYLSVIAATVFISHLSYQYFEKVFLTRKERFAPYANDGFIAAPSIKVRIKRKQLSSKV